MKRWRSLLFVAANDDRRMLKAGSRGADGLILDLEDAVPFAEKPSARLQLLQNVERLQNEGCDVVIRVNAEAEELQLDLDVVQETSVNTIVVPKVGSVEDIEAVLRAANEANIKEGALNLLALIESPAALPNLYDIAAHPSVIGLALGTEDFSLALGVEPSLECLDLPSKMISLAAASNECLSLSVPISIAEFGDLERYQEAARYSQKTGATGALCIHPNQVRVANQVFGISLENREAVSRIVDAWEAAQENGKGVISLEGKMIDRPVVERARQLLAIPFGE